jgi:hypothetical protein
VQFVGQQSNPQNTRCGNANHTRHQFLGGKIRAMRRELIWIDKAQFRGWGCSHCRWMFKPSGLPSGKTIGQMKRESERERDAGIESHVCNDYQRPS